MYPHLTTFCLLLLSFSSFGQSSLNYAKVQIHLGENLSIQQLADAGIGIDHVHKNEDHAIDFVVDEIELERLKSLQVPFEILIPNMKAYYATILKNPPASLVSAACGLENFDTGSMGSYHTYEEMIAHIQDMENQYPELVKVSTIGASLEGRLVYAVKISDNVEQDEAGEGIVFYDALTHAREPMGLESMLYYMWWLLENYGADAEATYLVDHRAMHFVPVVNPDGYVFNEINDPNGGGLWRKNRRDNGNNCFGVDLNRNYAFDWGNLTGASDDPCSNTYYGAAAFSEPETQNIRDFITQIKPSIGFSCHTYSDVMLFPNFFPEGFPKYEKYADFTSEFIPSDYKGYGTGFDLIGYSSSGNTRDFLHSEGIMCWVPEIGHSFWEPSSSICNRVQEFFPSLKYLAWVSGDYVGFHGYTLLQPEQLWQGDDLQLVIRVKNKGLSTTTNEVVITASSPSVVLSPVLTEVSLGAMAPEEIKDHASVPLHFVIEGEVEEGQEIPIDLTILQDGVVAGQKRLYFYAGAREVLFAEDAEANLFRWKQTVNQWDTTALDAYTGSSCVTDSKSSSYDRNTTIEMVSDPIDLSTAVNPFLEFKAKWSMERGDDKVTIAVQKPGSLFKPLRGKYTVDDPENGDPIYSFNQYWVEERIDLSDYVGEENIKLRVRLTSDGSVQSDGFYFDDFEIVDYQKKINVGTKNTTQIHSSIAVFPNPGNGQNTLEILATQNENAFIQITNPSGQIISEEKVRLQSGENLLPLQLQETGLYLIKVARNGSTETVRLVNF